MTDKDIEGEQGKVQADNNSIAVGGNIDIRSVQDSNIHIGNIIYNNVVPEPMKSPDLDEIIKIQYFEPETILIPEGPFWMGSEPADGIPESEQPQHEVNLPAYRIGIKLVTNFQYGIFVTESRIPVSPIMGWDGQKFPSGRDNFPAGGVTWYEALAYCEWLSEKSGRKYTLPNEAQWEKACRAGSNYVYPWGNEFDLKRSNHGCDTVSAVDAYPPQNEFGCLDMVGNILQWTGTLWGADRFSPDMAYRYPWRDDERNNLTANREIRRVIRGSAMKDPVASLRCSARRSESPDQRGFRGARMGFRVIMNIE
jgi:iron(II)-dependent oxidoreductase